MKKTLLFLFLIFVFNNSYSLIPEWKIFNYFPNGLTGHSAVMLPDGNVLIAGGINSNGTVSDISYLFDYKSGIFQSLPNLNSARTNFNMLSVNLSPTKVRIFAIAGYTGNSNNFQTLRSIEYLDYSIGQTVFNWVNAGDLIDSRGDCASAFDNSSLIIISGGFQQNSGALRTGTIIKTTETININSFVKNKIGDMNKPRAGHFIGTIKDEFGANQVLVSGGEIPNVSITEILKNNTWTTFANSPRVYHQYGVNFVDFVGIARMLGGINAASTPQNICEWYDVKAGWKYCPNMFQARSNSSITQIAGPKDKISSYLVVAGESSTGKVKSTEYYNLPSTSAPAGLWVLFQPLVFAASERVISMTGSNLPIVIGGRDASNNPISGVEIFQPIRASDLVFSPGEIGRISDSLILSIKNEWLLPVTLSKFRMTNPNEFFFSGDTSNFTIQPGSSKQIYIRCNPSDSGKRFGKLLFNIDGLIDTVNLNGTGIFSSLSLATINQSFGNIFVNSDTTICFPAIRNNGTDTTFIDSISVSPSNDYILISPIGRIKIPPNSSIDICIKFRPSIRNQIFGSAAFFLGTRKFTMGLDGRGILKYLKQFNSSPCDTVNYISGKSYPALVTLINKSDRDVIVKSLNFIGGANKLFSTSLNTPFNISVNQKIDIPIVFSPLSEGSFSTNLYVDNDGILDSLSSIPLCFVVRSQNISFVNSTFDIGSVCEGDTVYRTIFVENSGNFDTLTIDSIKVKEVTNTLSVSNISTLKLSPHARATATVRFISNNNSGNFSYTLVCYSSKGTSEQKINVNVKASYELIFNNPSVSSAISKVITIPVSINKIPNGGSISQAYLTLKYDGTLLHLNKLVSTNPLFPIDFSKSEIKFITNNIKNIKINWVNPVNSIGNAFGLEFETLLGSSDNSIIQIERQDSNSFCFQPISESYNLQALCGGKGSFISSNSKIVYNLFFNNNNINILFDTQNSGILNTQVYNNLGQIVYDETNSNIKSGVSELNINSSNFSNGLYYIKFNFNGEVLIPSKILILK
jgi:hypothetical protein